MALSETDTPGVQDLTLRLHRGPVGELVISATTPEGERSAAADVSVEDLLTELGDGAAGAVDSTKRDFHGGGPTSLDLETLGRRLFALLFPPPLRDLYARCRGGGTEGRPRRLRLCVRFDDADPWTAEVSSLPFELVHDGHGFLSLHRDSPVIRYLEVDRPPEPPRLRHPLRVLLVAPKPVGLEPLALQDEVRWIASEWSGRGVSAKTLGRPTLAGLRQHLVDRPSQVLHFLGHGSWEEHGRSGKLLFEDEDHGTAEVRAEELVDCCRGAGSELHLVVLNACNSARMSAGCTSVAVALVRSGVSAVVAMQRPILDAAAIRFGAVLHGRLASGDPIEAAITEARWTLRNEFPRCDEWMAPVLFLRSRDGHLAPAAAAGTGPEVDAVMGPVRAEEAMIAGRIVEGQAGEGGRSPWGEPSARVRLKTESIHVKSFTVAAEIRKGNS